MHRLVARLFSVIGQQNALDELRWMRQHLQRVRPPSAELNSAPKCLAEPAQDGNLNVLLEQMIQRRLKGEPLQYILESQPFGSLNLVVHPSTFIPRPETEFWCLKLAHTLNGRFFQTSLGQTQQSIRILDLCTGTGCIPLLLMSELPSGVVSATAVDIDAEALGVASKNAMIHNLDLNTVNLDIFSPMFADDLSKALTINHSSFVPFTIVTSNPPYIPRNEYEMLDASVRTFENPLALLGNNPHSKTEDPQGLAFYRRIAELLAPSSGIPLLQGSRGIVTLEVGKGQARAVRNILEQSHPDTYKRIDIWKDQWNVERVVVAYT